MKWLICLALLLVSVWAEADVDDHLKTIREKLAGGENKIDDLQESIRAKCTKIGGAEAFDKLEESVGELSECVQSNFNVTSIEIEIEESRKVGAMEEVFGKYCGRIPTVRVCVDKVVTNLENCLTDGEKSSLRLLLNITDSLAEFSCYKDGDRIAMFIAEDGVECIQSQSQKLEKCYTDTFNEIDFSEFSLDNLPSLTDNTEGCDSYVKFQSCVVAALEDCNDSTPANIIDALFRFVRRLTPCKNHKSPSLTLGNH